MDTTVNDQLFECQTCDFTANRIERGQGDRLGRIVNDEVYAGKGFQRTDVAALSAIMRPFISSFGSGTTETVASDT